MIDSNGMIKLEEGQIFAIIDRCYPTETKNKINTALINVFFNDYSMYRSEIHGGLDKNSLPPKVRRIKKEIEFIEMIINKAY